MLLNIALTILSISQLSSITVAKEQPFQRYLALRYSAASPIQSHSTAPTLSTPSALSTQQYEFKQSLLSVKKSRKKHKRTAKLQLLNMWIDPDITRLFIPRLKDIGRLSLNLHYSLKRSPYLLLDYEQITIKTKIKSAGFLQHEAYYNMDIEGAIIGVRVRGNDPLLYFRYRFK